MRVLVVGAGQMGAGIAQVMAQGGLQVALHDVTEERLQVGLASIEKSLGKLAEKGKVADPAMVLGQIRPVTSLEVATEVDLVVEAITESLPAKVSLFEELDRRCPPATILASNTSSLPITELAAATGRPAKVIGMHFMNPVPLMPLVEVIRGLVTSNETYETVFGLAKALGKVPVSVNDYPGFVSNRVLMPMINEAIFCLFEGVATAEDIDAVLKLGMNHPMGPLALADLIGLDTCLAILEVLYDGFKDPKYRPCPLLVKMVKAGHLGRKVGRGFYQYS